MSFIQEEGRDLKNIFNRFRKRDFSGTTGEAIKNSSYQLAQNLIFKFGSLLFMVFMARILLPDLMGIYSLALTTIVLFSSFSDLGISTALFRFVAKLTGQGDNRKAKAYFKKLLKWKIYLLGVVSFVLLLSSYLIAEFYAPKPIFYALLVGALYLPFVSFVGFLETIFKATGDFKHPLIKEIIFQSLRFTLVPFVILLLLKIELPIKFLIAIILLLLAFCYFIIIIILLFISRKKIYFLKEKGVELDEGEITGLKKFILPLVIMALSGVFFGYIDIIMLGHFVESKFIAYYGTAFALIGSAASIIGFAPLALFPIFSKTKGILLESIFRKSRNFVLLISLLAGVFTYFLAHQIIKIIYGSAYLTAAPILRWFAILIIILPIISLYDQYIISQNKTSIVAKLVVVTTLINVGLNIVFIMYGLSVAGQIGGVYGAVFATIISRFIYFAGVLFYRKRY